MISKPPNQVNKSGNSLKRIKPKNAENTNLVKSKGKTAVASAAEYARVRHLCVTVPNNPVDANNINCQKFGVSQTKRAGIKEHGVKTTICQTTIVSGCSVRANDLITIVRPAIKTAEIRANKTPKLISEKPGRIIKRAPTNPKDVAVHLRPLAISFKIIMAPMEAMIGRVAMIAATSPKGCLLYTSPSPRD